MASPLALETYSRALPGEVPPHLSERSARAPPLPAGLKRFSRVGGRRVTEQPERRKILDLLAERPGLTCAELSRGIERHYTTVRHHLRVLSAYGQVVAQGSGSERRFFPANSVYSPAVQRAVTMVRRPENARFMAALAERPGATQIDLAEALGSARSTVCRRIGILQRAGLVDFSLSEDQRLRAKLTELALAVLPDASPT